MALAVFALIAWAAAVIWALRAGCREGPAVGGPGETPSACIDLNSASAEELICLPGIGPVLSRRIVEERGRLGGFRSVDDLHRVRGVTKELVRRLRPFVKVGPPVRRRPRAGEAGKTGSQR